MQGNPLGNRTKGESLQILHVRFQQVLTGFQVAKHIGILENTQNSENPWFSLIHQREDAQGTQISGKSGQVSMGSPPCGVIDYRDEFTTGILCEANYASNRILSLESPQNGIP